MKPGDAVKLAPRRGSAWVGAVLVSIDLRRRTAIVKPIRHKATVEVDLSRVRLWKSRTLTLPRGGHNGHDPRKR